MPTSLSSETSKSFCIPGRIARLHSWNTAAIISMIGPPQPCQDCGFFHAGKLSASGEGILRVMKKVSHVVSEPTARNLVTTEIIKGNRTNVSQIEAVRCRPCSAKILPNQKPFTFQKKTEYCDNLDVTFYAKLAAFRKEHSFEYQECCGNPACLRLFDTLRSTGDESARFACPTLTEGAMWLSLACVSTYKANGKLPDSKIGQVPVHDKCLFCLFRGGNCDIDSPCSLSEHEDAELPETYRDGRSKLLETA